MTAAKRDDGAEIEVEYAIEQRGYPGNGWDDAGEPTIVTIMEAFDAEGNEVELTAAERERIEQEIAVEIDNDPGDDMIDF